MLRLNLLAWWGWAECLFSPQLRLARELPCHIELVCNCRAICCSKCVRAQRLPGLYLGRKHVGQALVLDSLSKHYSS